MLLSLYLYDPLVVKPLINLTPSIESLVAALPQPKILDFT
jgi:hypothetical protein